MDVILTGMEELGRKKSDKDHHQHVSGLGLVESKSRRTPGSRAP